MLFSKSGYVKTSTGCDALVITPEVRWALRDSKIKEGWILLHAPQSGAGWALLEPIKEIIEDLKQFCSSVRGAKGEGKNKAKEVIKTAPLLQGALLGASLTVPVAKGHFLFDPKLEIYLFDFTDTGKRREFLIQIMGEAEGAAPQGAVAPQKGTSQVPGRNI